MMSSIAKIVLLCAATSFLSQTAAAQGVVFPYNCDSPKPICQTDCVTAVNRICAGTLGPLSAKLNSTIGGCTAKYIPFRRAPETEAACLAGFQKILAGSNAAAATCDGKTIGRVGGVLALDANNQVVKGTSYAIFPAENNPNCVVHPDKIKELVPAKHNLLGTPYDCSAGRETGLTPSSLIQTRNTQAAKCGVSIANAAVCSAGCVLGVWATMETFGLLGAATVAGCMLCAAGESFLVATECNPKRRRSEMLGGPIYERATAPAYCSGGELNSLSLSVLPVCLQPALKSSCVANS